MKERKPIPQRESRGETSQQPEQHQPVRAPTWKEEPSQLHHSVSSLGSPSPLQQEHQQCISCKGPKAELFRVLFDEWVGKGFGARVLFFRVFSGGPGRIRIF